MVLLASDFDKSKYLSAGDLTQEKALRIKSVTAEMVRRGNGQPTKPEVVKETLDKFAAPPEPKPSLADDLDDEIGF